MKLSNLGTCSTIEELVNYKIDLFSGKDKNFETLFNIMFTEPENVMVEKTDGYKIIKTTYGQCKENIHRMAGVLGQQLVDFPKNSMVGIYMQNSLEWIEIFWGLLSCGYRPLLMNTRLDDDTLNKVLQQYGVAAVISDGKEFSVPTFNGMEIAGMDLASSVELSWADEIVVMSSGTSENVKLCIYNGESFYYQLCNTVAIIKESKEIKKHYEGELKLLTFLPFYHIFGLAAVYMWFGFFSRTFVILNDFGADTILNTVRKHKVTHIFAVPLLWNKIYDAALKKIKDRGEKTYKKFKVGLKLASRLDFNPALANAFSRKAFKEVRDNLFGDSICFLIAGGSHISSEVMSFFNGIGYHLADGFGMSEVGITSVETSRKATIRNSCSVGKPFIHAEYSIAEDGELLVRGKGTATRILCGDEVLEMSSDKWFHTKDMAREEKGRYYILGRKDDMIACKTGENLNPNRIEGQLMVTGVNALCLIAHHKEQGADTPVLLVEVSKYATADRINRIHEQLRKELEVLKLAGTINEIVFTTECLMGANDFKLNRHKLSRLYSENCLKVITPEKLSSSEESEISEELLAEVKTIIAEALCVEESEIKTDAHFFYDLDGSSLDYLSIVSDIQNRFNITFHQGDEESLVTVRELCRYIQDNV